MSPWSVGLKRNSEIFTKNSQKRMFTITWFFIQFEERETVHVLNVIQSWRRRRRLAKTHARWPYNMIFYSIWRERQFMCWMSLVYIDIILIYYQIVESENVFQSISTSPKSYLIFVIFFTRAKFLENEIYTEKRQFFALNL